MSWVGDLWVVPIGVGGAYALPGENQSSYLVGAGETRIVLDLGAGTLNALQRHVDPHAVDAVVISHLHADHCVDLFALRIHMVWGPGAGRRLRVIGPPRLRDLLAGFAGEDGWDDGFAFEVLEPPSAEAQVADVRLTFREVPHTPPTFAVRIDHDGHSITYGADCRRNDELAELAQGSDILIAECGDGVDERPESGHMTGGEAGSVAAAAAVGRLLLTHCYPEHDRDATLRAARDAFPGPVEWATQGVRVDAR